MEYISQEEIYKLNQSHITKEERKLLYILKLFKLNKPDHYEVFKKSLSQQEIEYIEDLIFKREGEDTIETLGVHDLNATIMKKVERAIGVIDQKLLTDFRIIIWES